MKVVLAGVERELRNRRYCLLCVPFRGQNNLSVAQVAGRRTSPGTARFRRWQERARSERKSALVSLLGGKCLRCGYDRCTAALEFHHREPKEKLFNLGKDNLLKRWEAVVAEAKKCDLVCANCHREIEDEIRQAEIDSLESGQAPGDGPITHRSVWI
ncbi:MAG: HNH endonuclease [Cytophagales bacterium]|nr:HNH endonuclease [Armatimonadota bacterium]